jgi:hypothetical protein
MDSMKSSLTVRKVDGVIEVHARIDPHESEFATNIVNGLKGRIANTIVREINNAKQESEYPMYRYCKLCGARYELERVVSVYNEFTGLGEYILSGCCPFQNHRKSHSSTNIRIY